jgi:hypothetical protein
MSPPDFQPTLMGSNLIARPMVASDWTCLTFVETVIFWLSETNRCSQGAMTKIGGIRREGLFTRKCRVMCLISSLKSASAVIKAADARWWREAGLKLSYLNFKQPIAHFRHCEERGR